MQCVGVVDPLPLLHKVGHLCFASPTEAQGLLQGPRQPQNMNIGSILGLGCLCRGPFPGSGHGQAQGVQQSGCKRGLWGAGAPAGVCGAGAPAGFSGRSPAREKMMTTLGPKTATFSPEMVTTYKPAESRGTCLQQDRLLQTDRLCCWLIKCRTSTWPPVGLTAEPNRFGPSAIVMR